MAEPVIPPKAKLFIGLIFQDHELYRKCRKRLEQKYGPIDLESPVISFAHTTYYQKIGENLNRVFFSFERLIKREDISKIKLDTNWFEKNLSAKGKREINIDPGYLTLSNVYLASCKEYFHRIYLTKGVYLENEYKYVGKKYQFFDWTYPDYQKQDYLNFFHGVREIYHRQLRGKN